MIKLYDPFAEVEWINRIENLLSGRCRFYASDLMEALDMDDIEEMSDAVTAAERACIALDIPIKFNFKKIFRVDENGIYEDWKLSHLACYLITINSDPVNPSVARAQIFFASKL
jgi:hypothetical protein